MLHVVDLGEIALYLARIITALVAPHAYLPLKLFGVSLHWCMYGTSQFFIGVPNGTLVLFLHVSIVGAAAAKIDPESIIKTNAIMLPQIKACLDILSILHLH